MFEKILGCLSGKPAVGHPAASGPAAAWAVAAQGKSDCESARPHASSNAGAVGVKLCPLSVAGDLDVNSADLEWLFRLAARVPRQESNVTDVRLCGAIDIKFPKLWQVLTLADLGASPERVTVSGTLAASDAAGREWLKECTLRGLQAQVAIGAE
jgi:hypothetical protein